jgi:antitoxin ChpS
MLSMPLRKQGGAAVVTIPPSVLKSLDLKVGSELQMDVRDGALVMVPLVATKRKRYTLAQLLVGATPAAVKALNKDTAWFREGDAVGRELA